MPEPGLHFKKIEDKIKGINIYIANKNLQDLSSDILKLIEYWISQVNPDSFQINTSYLICVIWNFFENDQSKNRTIIERYLCTILSNFNELTSEKILITTTFLNKYLHGNDEADLKNLELELATIPKNYTTEEKGMLGKLISLKNTINPYLNSNIKQIFNNNLSSKIIDESIAKLHSGFQFISENKLSSESVKKKKIRSALIYFDKNGQGHRVSLAIKNPKKYSNFFENDDYLNFNEFIDERQKYENYLNRIKNSIGEEFNRLAKIEISSGTKSSDKKFSSLVSLEDKESELFRRWNNIEKIRMKKNETRILKAKKEKRLKIIKVWGPTLASIQEKINIFKNQENQENQDILDNFFVELLSLKGRKNKHLVNEFLDYINYNNLKAFIKIVKEAYNLTKEVSIALNKIDNVRENLGFNKDYTDSFQKELENFEKFLSHNFIFNYLDNFFKLYKLTKFDSDEFKYFNYDLKEISDKIILKSPFNLSNFQNLDEIIANQQQAIQFFLKKNYINNNNLYIKKNYESLKFYKKNIFIKFLKKIKHFFINFLSIHFYFFDENHFFDFMYNLNDFITNQNQDDLMVDSINKFLKKLSWKTLISYGINPIHLRNKDIAKRLVQLLFLSLINKKCQTLNELLTSKFMANHDNVKKNISDKLDQIINKISESDILYHLGNDLNNLIEKTDSRDTVLEKLESDEMVIDLLEKIPVLKDRINLCQDQITKLYNFVYRAQEHLKRFEDNDINSSPLPRFKNRFFKSSEKIREEGSNLFNLGSNSCYCK